MENTKKTGEFTLHERDTKAVIGATHVTVGSKVYVKSFCKAYGCLVDVAPQKPVCVVWMEHRGTATSRGHSIEFEPAQPIQPQTEAFSVAVGEWEMRLHRTIQQPDGYALELWRNGDFVAALEWWSEDKAVTAYAEGDITAFEAFAQTAVGKG